MEVIYMFRHIGTQHRKIIVSQSLSHCGGPTREPLLLSQSSESRGWWGKQWAGEQRNNMATFSLFIFPWFSCLDFMNQVFKGGWKCVFQKSDLFPLQDSFGCLCRIGGILSSLLPSLGAAVTQMSHSYTLTSSLGRVHAQHQVPLKEGAHPCSQCTLIYQCIFIYCLKFRLPLRQANFIILVSVFFSWTTFYIPPLGGNKHT